MKRYIYIIIGIIIVAALAILVLFIIKNHSSGSSPSLNATTTGTLPISGTQGNNSSGTGVGTGASAITLPSSTSTSAVAGNGQMTVQNFGILSDTPVLDYFIDAQNNITALEPTGAVMTVSHGQSTVVSSSTIADIISAGFSYDGKKIAVSYGDPSNPQTEVFNVATNAWTALPKGMLSPQWSPAASYLIAYLAANSAGGRLALTTIDAANPKAGPSTLFSLNANDLMLRWPTKSEFILSDKPTSENAGSIWAFNLSTDALTPLVREIPGAEAIWSHSTTIPYGLIFFDNPSGQGNTLQLQPISGTLPTQPLGIATLPSKCAFNTEQMPTATSAAGGAASSTATSTQKMKTTAAPTSTPYLALYCGVPRASSGFSSAQLPDDYNTMALFTSDDIYKINTATGMTQSLWSDATQNVDVSDVKFFNNALFFINRYDQKLYGLTFSN